MTHLLLWITDFISLPTKTLNRFLVHFNLIHTYLPNKLFNIFVMLFQFISIRFSSNVYPPTTYQIFNSLSSFLSVLKKKFIVFWLRGALSMHISFFQAISGAVFMSPFVYPCPDLFVSICVTATDANLVMDHSHTLE